MWVNDLHQQFYHHAVLFPQFDFEPLNVHMPFAATSCDHLEWLHKKRSRLRYSQESCLFTTESLTGARSASLLLKLLTNLHTFHSIQSLILV